MPFTVITDSSCNLPENIIDARAIEVLPLTFMIDGQEYSSYLKGQHTDLRQFYDMMRMGKVITTSLPHIAYSEKLIDEVLADGNDILYVGFSSALSGTYESTKQILFEEIAKYPGRRFAAVDTLGASLGEGLLVLGACDMRDEGKSLDETAQWLRDNRLKCAHWFTVDDLMFLYRGGRVSRGTAQAGTVLNIKPVMHMDDAGALVPVGKARGRKRSIEALAGHMLKTFDEQAGMKRIAISHGDCIEDVRMLTQMILTRYDVEDIIVNYVDPVIGAHSGPGTLALFFMASGRN